MSDEPTITQVEGVKTDLPADQLADLQPKAEVVPEPAKPEEGKPAEPKAESPKVETPPSVDSSPEQPRDPEGKFKPKPKPIAKLLEQKHEAETRAEKAEREAAELRAQLEAKSTPAPAATPDIKAVAAKYGIGEDVLADIVAAARAGLPTKLELPKEVTDLVEARKQEAEQQAEIQSFDTRVKRLSEVFPNEPIGAQRDKLLELAYSTDKAPDGEPYYQKELSELYFAYIKPLVEPGKKSAESSQGGTGESTQILDFAEIINDPKAIEALDDATFDKLSEWMKENQKGSPMRRAK